MSTAKRFTLYIICVISGIVFLRSSLSAQAPYYDFDSLLQNNSSFQTIVQQVFDTFRVFGPEEPLELMVATDFKALTKNKYEDKYQPAQVIYRLWDSINISREIRIKPRGVLRLKTCSQPPLWVNVKKTKAVFQLLDDLDKLKLVVPCRGTSAYQQYIFSEYLIYRLYNIITDYSFKVRMIRINYSDTGGKTDPGYGFTFIIETHESLAKRLSSMPIKNENLNMKLIDPELAAVLYLFQFMVGNTDWSVHGLHNIKLIKTLSPTIPNPMAIPYDFDYAGLVNASYAVPGENVAVDRVTERAFIGHCLPEETMNRAKDQFLSKEEEVYSLVRNISYLSEYQKNRSLDYLQEFFEILRNSKRFKFSILNQCLN